MQLSFLFYFALVSALVTSPSTQCNGLMRKLKSESQLSLTCRKTSDFGFCVYTLQTDPRSAAGDVGVLAHIALEKLGAHAKGTSDYLQGLLKSATGQEAAMLGTCIQLYGVASSKDVPAAAASLDSKAYAAAKQAARAATSDGQGCQKGVDENPSPKWQVLSSRNMLMHDLSQLSSDLIGLLG